MTLNVSNLNSHLESIERKGKKISVVSLLSSVGMTNGNFRDFVDSVAETAIFIKTLAFPSLHTCRLHFPASLTGKVGHITEDF